MKFSRFSNNHRLLRNRSHGYDSFVIYILQTFQWKGSLIIERGRKLIVWFQVYSIRLSWMTRDNISRPGTRVAPSIVKHYVWHALVLFIVIIAYPSFVNSVARKITELLTRLPAMASRLNIHTRARKKLLPISSYLEWNPSVIVDWFKVGHSSLQSEQSPRPSLVYE